LKLGFGGGDEREFWGISLVGVKEEEKVYLQKNRIYMMGGFVK